MRPRRKVGQDFRKYVKWFKNWCYQIFILTKNMTKEKVPLCAQGPFQIELFWPKRKSILCTVALKSLKALDILSLLKTEKVTSFFSRRVLHHIRRHDYDTSLSAQGCVLTRYRSLELKIWRISGSKGVSNLNTCLDYFEDQAKSCENLSFCFPVQTEPFYWLSSHC